MTRLLFTLATALLCVAADSHAAPSTEPATDRPNIIVLFGDDQRADTIAALGNGIIRTPNLDRLVRKGVAFERAYMQGAFQGATCVPARAMLLSGRSLFRVDEKLLRDPTWPAAFGKAGYTTFMTGKWHNGPASVPLSFQSARGVFLGGMTDPLAAPLADLVDGRFTEPRVNPGRHSCATFADEAIRFIQAPHERPFLCYVAFNAPHDPHIVPESFPTRYDPAAIPVPANFLPQHPWDNGDLELRDEKLMELPRTPQAVQRMLADYYRYVSYMDSEIGRILDALAASPHAANTIVVHTADSGVSRGGHGLIGKQNLYEDSIRIPLVITGPGIPADRRSGALVMLHDLLPTLGKRCGIDPPQGSDGIDFGTALTHPEQPGRKELICAYRQSQRALITRDWKLIRYPQVGKTQLFDLTKDPGEVHNLANNPQHAARLEDLSQQLDTGLKEADASAPTAGKEQRSGRKKPRK